MKNLGITIVIALALLLSLQTVQDVGSVAAQTSACTDGEFLSLADGDCYPLEHPEWGYQPVEYSDAVYLPQCHEGDIRSALNDAGRTGGTIQLDDCRVSLQADLYIPGGVVFDGAGSVFDLSSGAQVRIKEAENVELKNLTIQGKGKARFPLWIEQSENILIERVSISDAGQGNLRLSFTPHATVRYSVISGAKQYHGISAKDCFGTSVDDDCGPESEYWSFYSNVFSGNKSHGANPHSSYGEFAGNMVINNGYGLKTPDSHSVVIHRNVIRGNDGWGLHIYRSYDGDSGRKSYDVKVAHNYFADNSVHVRVSEELQKDGVHLIRNEYDSNGTVVVVEPSMVHGCPGSEDVSRAKIKSDSPYCDTVIEPTPTVEPTPTTGTIPQPTETPEPIYLRCITVEDLDVLVCQEQE